jgi:hypothetical protein
MKGLLSGAALLGVHVGRLRAARLGFLLAVAACGRGLSPAQAPERPRLATLDVVGATIAPGKVGRTPWDGLGSVPESVWNDLGQALLQVEPQAAVLRVLANLANGTLDKPDVRARVELFVGNYAVARDLPKVQDSFTPQ